LKFLARMPDFCHHKVDAGFIPAWKPRNDKGLQEGVKPSSTRNLLKLVLLGWELVKTLTRLN